MVDKFKKFKELSDGNPFVQVILALLGIVVGLASFEYSRVTGDIEKRLAVAESQIVHVGDAIGSLADRLRSVEDANAYREKELEGIRQGIRELSDKIDRLTQRLYEFRLPEHGKDPHPA